MDAKFTGSSNRLFKRLLPAALILATVPVHAANIRPAQAIQKCASATLTINVIVMPVVQTPNVRSGLSASQNVSYSFAAKEYEQRYESRKLSSNEAPSPRSAQSIMRTLTIVPE
jgi:hypothetical protein